MYDNNKLRLILIIAMVASTLIPLHHFVISHLQAIALLPPSPSQRFLSSETDITNEVTKAQPTTQKEMPRPEQDNQVQLINSVGPEESHAVNEFQIERAAVLASLGLSQEQLSSLQQLEQSHSKEINQAVSASPNGAEKIKQLEEKYQASLAQLLGPAAFSAYNSYMMQSEKKLLSALQPTKARSKP